MPKLIDAEAAKAAIQYLADLQREFATHYEGRIKRLHEQCALCFDEAIAALDALPDASEGSNALAAQPQEGGRPALLLLRAVFRARLRRRPPPHP